VAAGFEGFEITWRKAVFDDAPQAGSAADFGTLGINFRARKPVGGEKNSEGSAPTPENYERVVEFDRSGRMLEGDPADLEAGANRCAAG
jgi:hypothetical protein